MPATFNARAETVAEKPMFRGAFRYRRCIIPASGFYEWTGGKGARQPHLFTAAGGAPVLAFAGLWDRWIDPDNFDEVISATIIVSGASAWMRPYHDRMPVLLEPKDFDAWLDGSLGAEALKPAAKKKVREHLVSSQQICYSGGPLNQVAALPTEPKPAAGTSVRRCGAGMAQGKLRYWPRSARI